MQRHAPPLRIDRPGRRRIAIGAVLALAAIALAGCESLMVASGMRMRLDGIALQGISASLPGNGALSPGASARLAIVATTADGRTLATVGTADGKVLPSSYAFEAGVVSVSADGVVSLPVDPRLSEGRTAHVRIRAAGQPTTAPVGDLDIPIRYDVAYAATFAGADGRDGSDGWPGSDGTRGAAGSTDPDTPSPGSDGGAGSDGMGGGDGGDGAPGPDVAVTVALAPGAHPLLRVRASSAGNDRWFLVDPAGGSLALDARGGHGGRGGAGGKGGSGGQGGSGSPSGNTGPSGFDGMSGSDGRPGAAGHVRVAVDPAAAPYLDRLHFRNQAGGGQAGPAPVITVAPVPSPW